MFIQKSKYLINGLLCRGIAEKSCEENSVGNFLDRIEAVKGIDTTQQSRIAVPQALFSAPKAATLFSISLMACTSFGESGFPVVLSIAEKP